MKKTEEIEKKLYDIMDSENKEVEAVLPDLIKDLNYAEKLELFSTILCDEWYLNEHKEFIKEVLDVFAKSL